MKKLIWIAIPALATIVALIAQQPQRPQIIVTGGAPPRVDRQSFQAPRFSS